MRYHGMHRVLPSPNRGFPGTKPPGIVRLIPTLTEHSHLPAVKASIALTHQASKSCAGYLGISIQKISVVRTMYEAYADCRWTFPVNSPHFHVGRQGAIRLERGTTLVCRVVIALAHYPSCRFRSSPQWGCLLATSS